MNGALSSAKSLSSGVSPYLQEGGGGEGGRGRGGGGEGGRGEGGGGRGEGGGGGGGGRGRGGEGRGGGRGEGGGGRGEGGLHNIPYGCTGHLSAPVPSASFVKGTSPQAPSVQHCGKPPLLSGCECVCMWGQ